MKKFTKVVTVYAVSLGEVTIEFPSKSKQAVACSVLDLFGFTYTVETKRKTIELN